jgi:RHS repeat-associated protein
VASAKSELYSYDFLNRLTVMARGDLNGTKDAISGTAVKEEDYTLDPTGNWSGFITKASGTIDLNQTRSHSKANEVSSISETVGSAWIDPVQNLVGNMTQMPKPIDPTTRIHLSYDAWNRLVEAKSDSGGSPGSTIATYVWDGQGRRIKKTTGGSTFDYFYNTAHQLLEVRKDADTDPIEQYVWDRSYIDSPVLWFHDSNTDGTVDDTLYVLHDANYNVTALLNSSGTAVERYTYDPYGQRSVWDGSWTARGSSSYAWSLGHQGLLIDGETGLIYNRARMLHPGLGRFIQRDRVKYGDGNSLYTFVRSNPAGRLDPTGRISIETVKMHLGPFLRCPKFSDASEMWWDFVLDEARWGDGFIVQKIEFYCEVHDWKTTQPTSMPTKPFAVYWEAWKVSGHSEYTDHSNEYGYTDYSRLPIYILQCAHLRTVGTIKYFSVDGPNAIPYLDAPGSGWTPGIVEYGDNGRCSMKGGPLSTKHEPSWWANEPDEGPEHREHSLSYDCRPPNHVIDTLARPRDAH